MALQNKLASELTIHSASRSYDIDTVKQYLANGADINGRDKHGMTPLSWAVKMRSAKIPIPAASGRGITEFSLRVALPQNPFLRPKGRGIDPQRLKASSKANFSQEMIEFLFANGADVNIKDQYETTPMHLAVIGGRKEIVLALIAKGAKLNTSGFQGKFPLHLAVEKNDISVAELLIANGAEINARAGLQGFTPLYFAKSLEMLDLLKKNGATARMYLWAEVIHFVLAVFEKLVSFGLTW